MNYERKFFGEMSPGQMIRYHEDVIKLINSATDVTTN